jgi:hypothetical protein
MPSEIPQLKRCIEVNRLAFYYSIIDGDHARLPQGTTVLFEWASTYSFSKSKEDEYTFGYVRYNQDGSREIIYENRYGKLEELKSEFIISYI